MTDITYDIKGNNTMINLQAAHEAVCIASATRAARAVAHTAVKVSCEPRQSILVTCEKFISRKLAAFNKRRLQLIINTLDRPY